MERRTHPIAREVGQAVAFPDDADRNSHAGSTLGVFGFDPQQALDNLDLAIPVDCRGVPSLELWGNVESRVLLGDVWGAGGAPRTA